MSVLILVLIILPDARTVSRWFFPVFAALAVMNGAFLKHVFHAVKYSLRPTINDLCSLSFEGRKHWAGSPTFHFNWLSIYIIETGKSTSWFPVSILWLVCRSKWSVQATNRSAMSRYTYQLVIKNWRSPLTWKAWLCSLLTHLSGKTLYIWRLVTAHYGHLSWHQSIPVIYSQMKKLVNVRNLILLFVFNRPVLKVRQSTNNMCPIWGDQSTGQLTNTSQTFTPRAVVFWSSYRSVGVSPVTEKQLCKLSTSFRGVSWRRGKRSSTSFTWYVSCTC